MPSRPDDEFENVRSDPDPLSRGRRATELLATYQQRSTELARVRREAIEEAHRAGMSYAAVAAALGLSRGRITQVRKDAPPPWRGIFGAGPVCVCLPFRYQTTDRLRPLIAAEDAEAARLLDDLLTSVGFSTSTQQIDPATDRLPAGDLVVICGPKSSPLARELLRADPYYAMNESSGDWRIVDAESGQLWSDTADTSYGYLSHQLVDHSSVLHIAGLHALGSLGVVRYLESSIAALYDEVKTSAFSAVVRSSARGLAIAEASLVSGPQRWPS